jgi:type IV secretion system protein VirB10
MKRRVTWFVVAVSLALWFAACGQKQETAETVEQPAAQQEAPAEAQSPQDTAARPATSQRKLAEARRPAEPTAEPAAAPAAQPIVVDVPQGTRIYLTLNDTLTTKTSQVGDKFSGTVSRPVAVNELVPIPMGSTVHGTVTKVERPGRVKGRAQLALRFEKIELPDGRTLEMAGTLSALGEEEKETVGEEGEVTGEGSRGRDAATIGGGAGVGAIIGGITGGKRGAAIGAGTGAAAGTAVTLLTRGRDIELKSGSEVAVDLSQPLSVQMP